MATSQLPIMSLPYDLHGVHWKQTQKVCNSSLYQLILTLNEININFKNSLATKMNIYKYTFVVNTIPLIDKLITNFYELLNKYESDIENIVFSYNLLADLPYGITIIEDNDDYKKLKYTNIGCLIRAIKQRSTFIIERDMPICYKTSSEYEQALEKLKKLMCEFLNNILEFELNFKNVIDKAHKAQQRKYNSKYYPK